MAATDDRTVPVPDPLARLGKGTVAVLFGASWCIPSRLVEGIVEEVRAAGGDVRVIDVDVWPQHAETFRIVSLPTLIRANGGTEKTRAIGAIGAGDIYRAAGLSVPKTKK